MMTSLVRAAVAHHSYFGCFLPVRRRTARKSRPAARFDLPTSKQIQRHHPGQPRSAATVSLSRSLWPPRRTATTSSRPEWRLRLVLESAVLPGTSPCSIPHHQRKLVDFARRPARYVDAPIRSFFSGLAFSARWQTPLRLASIPLTDPEGTAKPKPHSTPDTGSGVQESTASTMAVLTRDPRHQDSTLIALAPGHTTKLMSGAGRRDSTDIPDNTKGLPYVGRHRRHSPVPASCSSRTIFQTTVAPHRPRHRHHPYHRFDLAESDVPSRQHLPHRRCRFTHDGKHAPT